MIDGIFSHALQIQNLYAEKNILHLIFLKKMRILNGMPPLVPPIHNFYGKKRSFHLTLLKMFSVKCMKKTKFQIFRLGTKDVRSHV